MAPLQHSGASAGREACTDAIQLALNCLVLYPLSRCSYCSAWVAQPREMYKPRMILVDELHVVSGFAVSSIQASWVRVISVSLFLFDTTVRLYLLFEWDTSECAVAVTAESGHTTGNREEWEKNFTQMQRSYAFIFNPQSCLLCLSFPSRNCCSQIIPVCLKAVPVGKLQKCLQHLNGTGLYFSCCIFSLG